VLFARGVCSGDVRAKQSRNKSVLGGMGTGLRAVCTPHAPIHGDIAPRSGTRAKTLLLRLYVYTTETVQ
jgi:hypothetical protein